MSNSVQGIAVCIVLFIEVRIGNKCVTFFYSRTVHLDIIRVLLLSNEQENCFKRSIKIDIKTTPTCFGVITIIMKRTI